MVFVLDAHELASERPRGEARNVAGGEHVLTAAGTAELVDHDPVVDRKPGRLGELGRRHDPEPGHDAVGVDCAAAAEAHGAVLDALDQLARQHLDAALAVVARDVVGKLRREEARADPLLGEDHRHRAAAPGERRGDLGADEAAADDDEACTFHGGLADAAVVVEGPVVDDAAVAREAARPPARREQQALVAVRLAGVVDGGAGVQVDLDDAAREHELDAEVGGAAPDHRLVLPLPERLRERGPGVRRVGLLSHDADRAVGVVIANSAAGGVARHPPSDDQIAKFSHRPTVQRPSCRKEPPCG